ncbi:unnamed protein product [Cyclocybe aegerita]|uniref:Uncharacterized protein n=1 Tax=Cyclocybe aegerita TaxID=1973307 RepID=A0A8S0WMR4_CYCAE|nr:unnamed protein product [Cyclocybe aegerita]
MHRRLLASRRTHLDHLILALEQLLLHLLLPSRLAIHLLAIIAEAEAEAEDVVEVVDEDEVVQQAGPPTLLEQEGDRSKWFAYYHLGVIFRTFGRSRTPHEARRAVQCFQSTLLSQPSPLLPFRHNIRSDRKSWPQKLIFWNGQTHPSRVQQLLSSISHVTSETLFRRFHPDLYDWTISLRLLVPRCIILRRSSPYRIPTCSDSTL